MVKYSIMKRLTQLLASILFIITVLTVYLAFDFTVSAVVPKKSLPYRQAHIDPLRRTSTILSGTKSSNDDDHAEQFPLIDQDRRTRGLKRKANNLAKSAQFHKGKTGVKINQMKKMPKEQRKHFPSTKRTLSKLSV